MYLLDTNMISDVLRNEDGKAAIAMRNIDPSQLSTSVIVAGELKFGADWKGAPVLRRKIDAILGLVRVLPLNADVAGVYAQLRADLVRRGQPIGPNDLWIAAHAMALDAILVTDNEREFSRITGLRTENWLR